jgi:hypothetical protein
MPAMLFLIGGCELVRDELPLLLQCCNQLVNELIKVRATFIHLAQLPFLFVPIESLASRA